MRKKGKNRNNEHKMNIAVVHKGEKIKQKNKRKENHPLHE